jgi:glutathione S-transferase
MPAKPPLAAVRGQVHDGGTAPTEIAMPLTLYAHPFSSYSQKVLVALYENATPFDFAEISADHPRVAAEWMALWPLRRMPVLVDGDRVVAEASIIIEHLGLAHAGPARMIPEDPRDALDVRFMDRIFDLHVQSPMQSIVFAALREPGRPDSPAIAEARSQLDRAYAWLDGHMAGRTWAAGDAFSLADCAAAPALFYADWTHPIGAQHDALRAYRARLLARPSFARAVDEARPYRKLFPLGAPDRD